MRRGGRLANLLYPPACLLCHARLDASCLVSAEDAGEASVLCRECVQAAIPNLPPVCSHCGVGLPGAFDAAMVCRACRRASFAFDMARAPWRYVGPIRETVHQFKYYRRWRLGRWLASQMTRTAQDAFPLDEISLVLSVPSFWLKRRLKGFDPSQELGRAVARALKKPYALTLVRRTRWTPTQTRLHGASRFQNVRGAFAAQPAVARQTVVLIDDVLTSGATASACAQALKSAGADRVFVLTAARTPI
ncbi:MAG: ComF family protein [Candidatus Omnitrophica bacterium]|nr:ComF family protein [Candidatus Omnitrophota bacterium]